MPHSLGGLIMSFVSGEKWLAAKLLEKFGDSMSYDKMITKKYKGVELSFAKIKSNSGNGEDEIFIINSEDYFFQNQ